MKKIISFLIAVSFIVPSLAFAQTITSSQAAYTSALQQLISLLVQEVTQLEQQLAALNTNQNPLHSEISSSTIVQATSTSTAIYTLPPSQPQQTALPVAQTTAYPHQVTEGAELNFGSGFERPNEPIISPNQTITGELVYTCVNDQTQFTPPNMPEFCTPQPGDTSTLPSIQSVPLTLQIQEGISGEDGTLATTTQVNTDTNGSFSFTLPYNCDITNYTVTILNGDYQELEFSGPPTNSGSCSATPTGTLTVALSGSSSEIDIPASFYAQDKQQDIGDFTITAANENIGINTIDLAVPQSIVTAQESLNVPNFPQYVTHRLQGLGIVLSNETPFGASYENPNGIPTFITFANPAPLIIPAGQSMTFSVFASLAGPASSTNSFSVSIPAGGISGIGMSSHEAITAPPSEISGPTVVF